MGRTQASRNQNVSGGAQVERLPFEKAEERLLERLRFAQEELEDAIWQLVRFYSQAGKQELSFGWIQRLMSMTANPEKQALHYLSLGQLMEQVDSYEAAIDFYSQCLALDPQVKNTRYLAHNNTGFSLNQLLSYEAAEPYCRQAITLDPDRHNAYKNLGVSLEGQGKYVDAALNYYEASKKCPEDTRAKDHLDSLLSAYPDVQSQISFPADNLKVQKMKINSSLSVGSEPIPKSINKELTHAEQIIEGIRHLVIERGVPEFSRDDVRKIIGISREEWMVGYTAIFQAMRADQPGGAPAIRKEFQGLLQRISHGIYRLTPRGNFYIKTSKE